MTKPIGISPMNDMAFKKAFGSPGNEIALISLLNAILKLLLPIVAVRIMNPYNLQDFESDKLSILDIKDRRISGELHAHEYEADELLKLFPEEAFQAATRAIIQIAEKTEDKAMYDAREKANRDFQTAINSALQDGKLEGEQKGMLIGEEKGRQEGELIGRIVILQELLEIPEPTRDELSAFEMTQLAELAERLRLQLRSRGE